MAGHSAMLIEGHFVEFKNFVFRQEGDVTRSQGRCLFCKPLHQAIAFLEHIARYSLKIRTPRLA